MATRRKGGGRKPKPTALKLLHGTARKDRIRDDEPKPKVCLVEPPDSLSTKALAQWNKVAPQLFELGILSNIHGEALALYCEAYADWLDATTKIRKMGMLVSDSPKGGSVSRQKIILNPLYKVSKNSFEQMVRILCEFGMTPSSMTRIAAEKKPDQSDFDNFLNRGKKKA